MPGFAIVPGRLVQALIGIGTTDRDALNEATNRCRGPEDSWIVLDLKRAMILIGGLDEKIAQKLLDQEGT